MRSHATCSAPRLIESADELATPRLHALRAWGRAVLFPPLPAGRVPRGREPRRISGALPRQLRGPVHRAGGPHRRRLRAVRRAHAPATLDWLSRWLGTVMDPAVEAERKRLLIRFAVPLFQYRGTTQGLRLATELVLSSCVRPRTSARPLAAATLWHPCRRALPDAAAAARAAGRETLVDAPRRRRDRAWAPPRAAKAWTGAGGRHWRRPAGAESAQYTPVEPQDHAATGTSARRNSASFRSSQALRARWSSWLSAFGTEEREASRTCPPTACHRSGPQAVARLLPRCRRTCGAVARWQGFLARRYRSTARTARSGASGPSSRWCRRRRAAGGCRCTRRLGAVRDAAGSDGACRPPLHRARAQQRAAGRGAGAGAPRGMGAASCGWRSPRTVFDVRPTGRCSAPATRAGLDTVLGEGSRAPRWRHN